MALRVRKNVKMEDEENALIRGAVKEANTRTKRSVLGIKKDDGFKKEVAAKRGALGEISNRAAGLSLRQVTAGTKKNTYKDVQAKVVTRHVAVKAEARKTVANSTINSTVANSTVANSTVANSTVANSTVANTTDVGPTLTKTLPVTKVLAVAKMLPVVEEAAYSAELLQVYDIDTDNDPVQVSQYVRDIYKYLKKLELQSPIRADHLSGQQVTRRMRAVLVDWLVEVHDQFRLLPETLYLTVSVIDRFLQARRTVTRTQLQLVGVAALSVASKYEEMYAPEVSDYVYISDNTCSKEQILSMECTILKVLDFNFSRPIPLHFLRRYSRAARAPPATHTMAKYLLELSLTEYKMCHLPPSMTAAAAVCLAVRLMDGAPAWSATLAHYSSYALADIAPVVRQLAALALNAVDAKQQATRTKYATSKLMGISRRPEATAPVLEEIANGSGDAALL